MFVAQSRYRLCEAFGIPVYLDLSLVVLLLMFVISGSSFSSGIVCAFLLLVSITLHEFGHALTARAFGYQTRDITLSLLGGCASLIALPRKASQEFMTAIAGPAVSFAISFVGMIGLSLAAVHGSVFDAAGLTVAETLGSFGLDVGWGGSLVVSRDGWFAAQLCLYLATMNMMLGLFNMLPGFPMDGGRVFRSAMRQFMSRVQATYIAMVVGRVVAVGIGLRGLWHFVHGGNWGVVSMLIAWMIWKEGWREYMLARMESSWDYEDYRARVSPPPYGGDGDESDVRRGWGAD